MSKFTVDRLYDLRPRRYCWRCCLVPRLICYWDVSAGPCILTLFVRGLQHPDALERQAAKLSHVLVIIRRIGSNVGCGGHDRNFPSLGQYVDLIEFCL
jgi:hypothetical protein